MRSRQSSTISGVALIVVLFAVALVSIVVLAYFNLAMLNRNISFSSAGEARANIVALSALDFIKGDFIAEIQAGSTQEVDPTGANVPIYVPTTNTTMVPYRMTTNISPLDPTIPYNLVKWSSGTYPLWPATTAYNSQAGPIRAFSGISSTNASVNGHFLTNSLWTKPNFGTNSTFPASVVPSWVYMTRQGPLSTSTAPAMSTLANSDPTNSDYVIGRYAYTVYDEGGLLDISAAGYSMNDFSSDPTDVGRKGSQGFADLTQLGLTAAQIDQFVKNWRNLASASSAANYLGYLTTNAPATGFMKAATNDQAFVSRQDFMAYWTNSAELGASATNLPYLTTFSREKNAPSWGPEHDASDPNSPTYWNGSNADNATTPSFDSVTYNDPPAISYAYHSNRDNSTAYNRFFPNVRVQTPFTRLSGETAVVGEPLVKNRFDLSKLAWITYEGPSAGISSTSDPDYNAGGTAANIYKYFGLIPNYSASGAFLSWTYNHTTQTAPTPSNGTLATDTSSIMTLGQVASLSSSLAREPDFFELLQAVILRGSLGNLSGDPSQEGNTSDSAQGGEFYRAQFPINPGFPLDDGGALYRPMNNDSSSPLHVVNAQSMYQVIQIGANIIDQYDTDNFPTEIVLNKDHFYGIENLPYINAIGDAALRVAAASPPAAAVPPAMTYDITSTTDSTISGMTANQAYVHRWLDFALWNPHQNAANPPTLGPAKIRIAVVQGQEYPLIVGLGAASPAGGTDYSGRNFQTNGASVTTPSAGSPPYAMGPAWIGLPLTKYANHFSEPTMIDYTNSYTSDTDSANDAGSLNINDPDGRVQTSLGWQRAGIYLGWSLSPDNPYKVPACVAYWPNYKTSTANSLPSLTVNAVKYAGINVSLPFTIYLQYEDINNPGTWHTYEELHNLYYSRNTGSGDSYMEPSDTSWSSWLQVPTPPNAATGNTSTVAQMIDGSGDPATYNGSILTNMDTAVVASLDPRTTRFNLWSWHNSISYGRTGGTGTDSMPISTVASIGEPSKGFSAGPHFGTGNTSYANPPSATPGSFAKTWVDNVSISPMKNYDYAGTTSFYSDRDFIPRLGDAAGWTNVVLPADVAAGNPAGASPINPSAQMQRPLHLDRPFRSVAELGYVFRDDPWKSLNFFSANSGDAGLLDVFYIGASTTNTPVAQAPDVIAGKININSAALNILATGTTTLNSPVLQALISQTLRDYQSPAGNPTTLETGITTASDIKNLSTNIVNYIKVNGPLVNIADLPGVFPQVTAASVPVPLYTGLKNPSEALIRSLADSSGTRTWNLMIDVVAQAGKFSPTAANLNNFTVEGEKHYWLHVAIDRFTGEIVDQQFEPVWE